MSPSHFFRTSKRPSILLRKGTAKQCIELQRSLSAYIPVANKLAITSNLDRFLLTQLTSNFDNRATSFQPTPSCSFTQYRQNAHIVLDHILPTEPYPSLAHRGDHHELGSGRGDGLVLVIHATRGAAGVEYTVCSGFIVRAKDTKGKDERYVVTCAHTLEEIEYHHPSTPKQTFIVLPSPLGSSSETERNSQPLLLPICDISTSLPRADLLICRLPSTAPTNLRALPVSPYPVSEGQKVLVHFFGSPDPPIPRVSPIVKARAGLPDAGGEEERVAVAWPGELGWRRWVKGRMLGYRGHTWREVEAGTEDSLPFILTSPLPSPGSSGGPILDAETGAVVGVISGTRMDNRVEGERGWGASAENIFELFSLAGFTPISKSVKAT